MKVLSALTQAKLKELLHYEPETGVFTWIESTSSRIKIGDIAGNKGVDGYIDIRIYGKLLRAHRLAYLYMTGEWPANHVDHINGIKHCNIWTNLRECTQSQNLLNIGMRKNNKSGFKGVSWGNRDKKWRAQAQLNGKHFSLGSYCSPELASEAYQAFATEHHGEFFRATV